VSNRPAVSREAPRRLRSKIALVLTLAAIGGFSAMAGAGWLLVLEAEDAILEGLVAEAVQAQERPEGAPSRPPWLTHLLDDAALCRSMGLAAAPASPGPHELFASADGSASVLIAGFTDRWRVWLASDREREFRLRRDRAGRGWWLADLSYFEFTEARVASVRSSLLAASVAVGLLALLLSALIIRWTVRPVVALAARVQAGSGLTEAPARPFAEGCADDEVGFLARSLDESRERVAAALGRERQFIAECSHELRTPLAVLKAAAALLPEVAEEPEGRARALARMTRAVQRAERLVQFFLVLAREGRERADVLWVPLRAVAEEAIEDQRAIRPDPTRVLAVAIPPEVQVLASREVLLMLVHNLVGNALQHAPEGQVAVAWSADATLTIDDEGPGFPDAGEDARPRGYGVGLALARRLCETQGWALHTARSPAGGARVSLHFPDAALRERIVVY
jgi:signal transduction histidine kinase